MAHDGHLVIRWNYHHVLGNHLNRPDTCRHFSMAVDHDKPVDQYCCRFGQRGSLN